MIDAIEPLIATPVASTFGPRVSGATALGWLSILSESMIGLAFVSATLVLLDLARRDRRSPSRRPDWALITLIAPVGWMHLLKVVTAFSPVDWLLGLAQLATAVAAWTALLALVPAVQSAPDAHGRPEPGAASRIDPAVRRRPWWWGYGLALVALGLALGSRWVVGETVFHRAPFLPLLIAVVVTSRLGGLGPALAALLGGFLAMAGHYLIPTDGKRPRIGPDELTTLGLFTIVGLGISLIGDGRHVAQRRARTNVRELLRKRHELEKQDRWREQVRARLLAREKGLRNQAAPLAEATCPRAEPLVPLDALIANAPVELEYLDVSGCFLRVYPKPAPLDSAAESPLPLAEQLRPSIQLVSASGDAVLDRVDTEEGQSDPGADPSGQAGDVPVRATIDSGALGEGAPVQNIGKQPEALRQLEESEARLRALAEAMPQMVWVARPDGRAIYFNHRWYEYTGQTVAESMEEGWSQTLHADDLDRARERWRHAIETGEVYEIEYRLRARDGHHRWYLVRGLPRHDTKGTIVGWIGSCTDIDDLKRSQAALLRSEERFRLLAEALPQIVWMAGPDGEMDYFNQRWRDYTGARIEEGLGQGWLTVLHPRDLEATLRAWRQARARGAVFEVEQRLRRHDGAYRWHLARAVPLKDATGSIVQWVGSTTDIDDHKRGSELLERLVRERTKELERSNRELEEFAYVASHDLQEPLRKIQTFGERLASRFREGLGGQGLEDLDRVLVSAARMRKLIDDLLTFSRVMTKSQPFEPVDLSVIAADAVSDLEGLIQLTGGRVELGGLPTIEADAAQARRLLQNLIANALKFHKPNVAPIVRVEASLGTAPAASAPGTGLETCELRVVDNGIGFEEKDLDRIFQAFQRLHGGRQYEGTGVGLAICRKIVERHGGTLTARSAPGLGATFVAVLPIHHPRG